MKEIIYIGGYSNYISIYMIENGKINYINKITGVKNPSYLNINKDFLYSVEESEDGKIASYQILGNELKFVNELKLHASLPCYISTDKERKNLLVANYGSGSMILYGLKENGAIDTEKKRIVYDKGSHIHYADFIKNHIYVIDLGNDYIYIYNLKLECVNQIKVEKGTGPRHLVVDNDENILYVVTEYSNQIFMYKKEGKEFVLKQEISTKQEKSIESYASAIKMSKDNKYIYVTNRGENTISVFEKKNDKLKQIQSISSYGDFPRDIILTEDENHILVANQKSNSVVIFYRNRQDGTISENQVSEIKIEKPSCIIRRRYGI